MPRYKKEKRDQAMSETRYALLEAAAEEFAREGFNGANINRISQSAGYAKGTVYNYFESKHALMQALIEDTAALHFRYIADRVMEAEKADGRLKVFFEAGFEFVSNYHARALAIVNNLYGPTAGFKDELYSAYLPMFELVGVTIIALGVEQGLFRSVDPIAISNLLMFVYLGIASQVGPEGTPWLEAQFVADFALKALEN